MLTQIAAEALSTVPERICIRSGDTDYGTYDSGAFASSTTYVAGNAVLSAAKKLRPMICQLGATMLACPAEDVEFDGGRVFIRNDPEKFVTIEQIGTKAEHGGTEQIITSATFVSGLAPLTFMSGFAEIDLDLRTGKVELLKFVSVADCGRVINPTLARVQAEGGILMGIGLALFEEVHYGENGKLQTDSFMQYKIPCRRTSRQTV